MRTGLTLGKFAPLHKGHQYLIERALEQVDRLIVIVYGCPDLIPVPLSRRAGWIRELYPGIEVIEAPDGPLEVGKTRTVMRRHEEYILRRLAGRRITHFFSSEFYGEHVSRALGARDCRIDEARVRVPISASQIRLHYFAHRRWLDDLVYRSLVTKVLFLGAPSTGKTTLARTMAERLGTNWMPEYGHTYWLEHAVDRRLSPQQLVHIAQEHMQREDRLLDTSDRFLFVDTSALTTFHFALDYHGFALPALQEMARISEDRYDHVFLCDDDIPYADTWDRSGAGHRSGFQEMIREDLKTRSISHVLLQGDLETRVERVSGSLGV